MRAFLGSASHFCGAVVLKLRRVVTWMRSCKALSMRLLPNAKGTSALPSYTCSHFRAVIHLLSKKPCAERKKNGFSEKPCSERHTLKSVCQRRRGPARSRRTPALRETSQRKIHLLSFRRNLFRNAFCPKKFVSSSASLLLSSIELSGTEVYEL